jgi:hypothetical protein
LLTKPFEPSEIQRNAHFVLHHRQWLQPFYFLMINLNSGKDWFLKYV